MIYKNKIIKIGEAAKLIGVTPQTLRKWEKSGQLMPAYKTDGGTRFYRTSELPGYRADECDTVIS